MGFFPTIPLTQYLLANIYIRFVLEVFTKNIFLDSAGNTVTIDHKLTNQIFNSKPHSARFLLNKTRID